MSSSVPSCADTLRCPAGWPSISSLVWEVRDRFVEGDRWLERALELPGPTSSRRSAASRWMLAPRPPIISVRPWGP